MKPPDSRQQRLVTASMLEDLPGPARRYLERTGAVGQPWIYTARVRYKGKFRLGAEKPWMSIKAEQVYTTDPPGFRWEAHLKMFGLWLVSGSDTYRTGHGHMTGKVAGLYTIFDARGEEIDQGAMVRYLNEMTWFPIALLNDYVSWRPVDDHSCDVTFTDRHRNVGARIFVDDQGLLTDFVAEPYREEQGAYRLDTWSTPILEYGRRAGLNLPVRGQAVWKLPTGDLPYANLELTSVEYNVPIEDF